MEFKTLQCAQDVESPHYDDYAPLHCLTKFVASDDVHFLVGVGVDIGIANIAAQNFQVGLVCYHLEKFYADGLDGGGVDVVINGVDEVSSRHKSTFVSQVLLHAHDDHEREAGSEIQMSTRGGRTYHRRP